MTEGRCVNVALVGRGAEERRGNSRRRRRHGFERRRRSDLFHPAVPAESYAGGVGLAQRGQSPGRQGRAPGIDAEGGEIHHFSEQGLAGRIRKCPERVQGRIVGCGQGTVQQQVAQRGGDQRARNGRGGRGFGKFAHGVSTGSGLLRQEDDRIRLGEGMQGAGGLLTPGLAVRPPPDSQRRFRIGSCLRHPAVQRRNRQQAVGLGLDAERRKGPARPHELREMLAQKIRAGRARDLP